MKLHDKQANALAKMPHADAMKALVLQPWDKIKYVATYKDFRVEFYFPADIVPTGKDAIRELRYKVDIRQDMASSIKIERALF